MDTMEAAQRHVQELDIRGYTTIRRAVDPKLVDELRAAFDGYLGAVRKLHEQKANGRTINSWMKSSPDARNPYILEKIIKLYDIDETATHVPVEVFDPSSAIEAIGYYDDAHFGRKWAKRAQTD